MKTKPPVEDDNSGSALARSLLAAAVQGLIRAMLDMVLGRWGQDLQL
jgi:hypothetical protein